MLQLRDAGVAVSALNTGEVYDPTCPGPLKVMGRVYRDAGGRRQYLLDEVMGMNKRSHVTKGVQVPALDLASILPYRRSAEV